MWLDNLHNINQLFEPDDIKKLLLEYYIQPNPTQPSQTMSSHWQYYSDNFKVEIQSDGTVKKLEGLGFGEYITLKFADRVLDLFTIMTYLIVLSDRLLLFSNLKLLLQLSIPLTYDAFR